jgi:hypothetical protein
MTVFKWSTTAASNDDIDATINWQEGQSPASVNNSARAMMAAIARWRTDMAGTIATSGSSTAYTATSSQGFTSLTSGMSITLFMHVTNGASPTLNVDGLGAKTIRSTGGVTVGAGKLRVAALYTFVYFLYDDAWFVAGNPNDAFEPGTKVLFRQTAAPTGWTKDTTYTDAALRVTSGSISQQATSGKEFSTLFAARTIATANLPSHSHTFSGTTSTDGAHTHTYTSPPSEFGVDPGGTSAPRGSNFTNNTGSSGSHSHTYSGTTSSVGSGTAMDFAVNFVDVIIATRD